MTQGAENGKKRAILWDNDGVLVDTERWFFEANRLELAAMGVTATWAQFEEVNLKHGTRRNAIAASVTFEIGSARGPRSREAEP
jgi:beta-phosphoglucomutase-like phosphatase (HAD superfamily)